MWKKLTGWFRPAPANPEIALVMSGGGARGAYQAGVLKYIAEAFPKANFPIMTGVSAGAINASHLANHVGSFGEAARYLIECWLEITPEDVYQAESSFQFVWGMLRRGRTESEEEDLLQRRALVDTAPLRNFLEQKLEAVDGRMTGVAENLQAGRLKAYAIITTNYATGQTVTWVQGRDISRWERPNRVGINTTLTVDHIMASTALPLLFPAIRIGDAWYGDGGIRLSAPLAPAIHLGADRILAISTRYSRTRFEADQPSVLGYPPTAQILGMLMNAIFLDALDQDAEMMDRINRLLSRMPQKRRMGLRPVRLLMLRPSIDIGKLAGEYQLQLSGVMRVFAGGLGSKETKSPDWLSMLLFERNYVQRLIEIGYHDAKRQHLEIEDFLFGESVGDTPKLVRSGFE